MVARTFDKITGDLRQAGGVMPLRFGVKKGIFWPEDFLFCASQSISHKVQAPMKIVLAYSGGLDTSVIVKWLKETYDAEIITFAADIGQEEELKGLSQKA